jgi:hypothetical protein
MSDWDDAVLRFEMRDEFYPHIYHVYYVTKERSTVVATLADVDQAVALCDTLNALVKLTKMCHQPCAVAGAINHALDLK